MFPGYASRIDKELRKLYVDNNLKLTQNKNIKIHIEIVDSPRRKYSAFTDATVLSNVYSTSEYNSYWISKKDWEESGPSIIQKKCQSLFR